MVPLYRTRIFRRQFLSFVGLTLFSFGAMSLAILFRTRLAIEARQLEITEAYGSQVAQYLLDWTRERKANIDYLSRDLSIELREGVGSRGIKAHLEAFVASAPGFVDALLASREGYVLESYSEAGARQIYIGDRDYFREALSGSLSMSGYLRSRLTGTASLVIAAPVRGANGVEYVLAGVIPLEVLARIVDGIGLAGLGEAFLLDRDRRIISNPDFLGAFKADSVSAGDFELGSLAGREIAAARSGSGRYRDGAGRQVFGSFRWIEALHLGLVIELSAALALRPVTALLEFTLLLALSMFFLLLLLSWTLSARLIGPIAALIEAARSIAENNFRGPIEIKTGAELGQLVRLFNFMAAKIREREEGLRESASRDSLTGLYNRGRIEECLRMEIGRKRRSGGKVAFVMLDIDHFKSVNDRYGHLAGDEALRRLATILEENAREGDIVGRYGGEEFAVILSDASASAPATFCERIRSRVETERFDAGDQSIGLTVSLGWTLLDAEGLTPFDLIRNADRALYEAKKQGRNRFVGSTEEGG